VPLILICLIRFFPTRGRSFLARRLRKRRADCRVNVFKPVSGRAADDEYRVRSDAAKSSRMAFLPASPDYALDATRLIVVGDKEGARSGKNRSRQIA